MPKYVYRASGLSDGYSLTHFNLPIVKKVPSLKEVGSAVSSGLNRAKTAVEREWKKHKWVDRKRGKDGKWIYDYGNGFPDEKKPDKKQDKKKAQLSPYEQRVLAGRHLREHRQTSGTITRERPKPIRGNSKLFEDEIRYQRTRQEREGRKRKSFKDLDYDSSDYVSVNGQKVRKAEDGTAYVRTGLFNSYHGDTPKEAARKANVAKQKRSSGLKTHRGKQVY